MLIILSHVKVCVTEMWVGCDWRVTKVVRVDPMLKGKTLPAGENKHQFHKRGLEGRVVVCHCSRLRNQEWGRNSGFCSPSLFISSSTSIVICSPWYYIWIMKSIHTYSNAIVETKRIQKPDFAIRLTWVGAVSALLVFLLAYDAAWLSLAN